MLQGALLEHFQRQLLVKTIEYFFLRQDKLADLAIF